MQFCFIFWTTSTVSRSATTTSSCSTHHITYLQMHCTACQVKSKIYTDTSDSDIISDFVIVISSLNHTEFMLFVNQTGRKVGYNTGTDEVKLRDVKFHSICSSHADSLCLL